MQFGMWAYPWDIVDKGPQEAVDELVDIGIDSLYVAANYHTVQAFSTHNPERKTFFTDASAYFEPSEDYGELAPVQNEQMQAEQADWIEEVADAVSDSPLQLNAWVVGCHNSTLGMEHEEYALESPFGDPLVFGLCPSQPAVQKYLKTMLADLDSNYPFEDVLLETFHYFHGSGWSWHHDKFHTDIGELGEYLLGLCFCEECQQNARDAGVAVEEARKLSKETILALAEGEMDSDVEPREWLEQNEAVKAYSDVRQETLSALYEEFASETDVNIGGFIGMKGIDNSWMHGLDLETLQGTVDYFTIMDYLPSTEEVIETYEHSTDRITETPVRAGILPGHPIVDTKEAVTDQIVALSETDTEEVTIYNYGLLPERNLSWVKDGIEQVN